MAQKIRYKWFDKNTGKEITTNTVKKHAREFLNSLKSGNVDDSLKNFINNNYERRIVINGKTYNTTSSNSL